MCYMLSVSFTGYDLFKMKFLGLLNFSNKTLVLYKLAPLLRSTSLVMETHNLVGSPRSSLPQRTQ